MPWGIIIQIGSRVLNSILRKQTKIDEVSLMDPFLMDLTTKVRHVIGRFNIIPARRTIINTEGELEKFVEYLDNITLATMDLDIMTGTLTTSSIVTTLQNSELIEFLNFSNTSYTGHPRLNHMIEEMIRVLPRYRHELLENIIVTKTMIYNSRIESSVTERFEFIDVSYAHLIRAINKHFMTLCKDNAFSDNLKPETLDTFTEDTCVLILTKFADIEFVDTIDEIRGEDAQLLIMIENENLMIDISDTAGLIDALEIYRFDQIVGLYIIRRDKPVWLIIK